MWNNVEQCGTMWNMNGHVGVSCRDLGHDAQFPEMSKAFPKQFAAKIPNRVPLSAKFRDSVQVVQVVRCNSQHSIRKQILLPSPMSCSHYVTT